jgi:hypothetical protein
MHGFRLLIALGFSSTNQCTNLISAVNAAGCLPSSVYKARDTPYPLCAIATREEVP